ncbi:glycosyltransferase [Streptomyces sp. NPDC018610]|uniref:glycosyltransferase n=1 Tax=Streptomyces sp. NPDC018610 TaxID=3365049 RepID=UPI003796B2D2
MSLDWHHVLAGAAVAGTDPSARSYSPPCWKASRPRYAETRKLLGAAAEESKRLRYLMSWLDDSPDRALVYGRLCQALAEFEQRHPAAAARLRSAGLAVGKRIRLLYHAAATGQETAARTAPDDQDSDTFVHVVIPFRAREAGSLRERNLHACINALARQTLPRERFTVTLVESDAVPRHRAAYASRVDNYVFHRDAGDFNKAAAVNLGTTQEVDRNPLLCLLDADIVLDRGFLARAVASAGASWAALPYEDAFCLDSASSAAVADHHRAARPERAPQRLAGYLIRRPPGGCVLVTHDRFTSVGGFDERFVGWGGEDRDLINRLERAGGVERQPGKLLHLMHERPPMREDHETIMRTGLIRTAVPA